MSTQSERLLARVINRRKRTWEILEEEEDLEAVAAEEAVVEEAAVAVEVAEEAEILAAEEVAVEEEALEAAVEVLVQEKCIKPPAAAADRNVKFLLSPRKADRSIAEIVSNSKDHPDKKILS